MNASRSRVLSALLVLGLLAAPAGAAAVDLLIGSDLIGSGEDATIPISMLASPGEQVSALSLEIRFDPSALDPNPTCVIAAAIGPGSPAGKDLTQTTPASGLLRLGIFGLNNNSIPDGTVATCTFTAPAGGPSGTWPLAGKAGAASPSGSSLPALAQSGSVVVNDDGDGIPTNPALPRCATGQTLGCSDNCEGVPNPGQFDRDGDGYGNVCDCDFDNDGFCSISDFNLFLPDFQSTVDSGVGTDMNGDGSVGISDFNLFLPGFVNGTPGP